MTVNDRTRLVVTLDGLKLKVSHDESCVIGDLQKRGLSARQAFAFILAPEEIALLDSTFAKGGRVALETLNHA
jgi:hypothetical protein